MLSDICCLEFLLQTRILVNDTVLGPLGGSQWLHGSAAACVLLSLVTDPYSPWCNVGVYTKIEAETAILILFDVYDTCRLWALSPKMFERIRRLDIRAVLWNEGNSSDCTCLLDAIEG